MMQDNNSNRNYRGRYNKQNNYKNYNNNYNNKFNNQNKQRTNRSQQQNITHDENTISAGLEKASQYNPQLKETNPKSFDLEPDMKFFVIKS